ncbi:MAG: hypothetical protein P4M12_02930 [Gammaproteobacteria bacterium]|nr:hypothetical protein [Gammaproteobacteria bacterium]
MTTDTNTDKLDIAEEPKDSPEARASRLRRLRNLANLSRKEMCTLSDIKPDTLIGWEVARHGGLTENGAKKVIDCVTKEGVQCTLNWLLYDIGAGPSVLANYDEVKTNLQTYTQEPTTPSNNNEEKLIIEELLFFHSLHHGSIDYLVEDDAMSPLYLPNDYVAGIKQYKKNISKLIGYDCIVQMADGKILLRCLRESSNKNKYTLLCTNTKTNSSIPILHDVELVCAAPVIWIRRKNPKI